MPTDARSPSREVTASRRPELIAGRYHIRRKIGQGGMGAVYLATDLATDLAVALKVMAPHLRGREDALRRFAQEARLASLVADPAVPRVLEQGTERSLGWIAMEMLSGETLANRLERGRLTSAELEVMVPQLLRVLQNVHLAGIVHRDLKPQNIFLERASSGDIRVRLLDFGIAKLTESDELARLTPPGVALGTPAYMAPEQAAQTAQASLRGDIYSIGAILYECLSTRVPYPADSVGALVRMQLTDRPRPLIVADDELPYARVAAACLEFHEEKRPSSCAEVWRLLATWTQAVDALPTPSVLEASRCALALVGAAAIACAVWLAVLWLC